MYHEPTTEQELSDDLEDYAADSNPSPRFARAYPRVEKISLPSQFPSNRYFFRRRSISLTSEAEAASLSIATPSGRATPPTPPTPTNNSHAHLNSRMSRVDRPANANDGAHDRDATPTAPSVTVRRRVSRSRYEGCPSSTATPSSRKNSLRPGSIVVHENEELLRLAHDLEYENSNASDSLTGLHFQEDAAEPLIPKSTKGSSNVAIVRRNSSGYSTGSASSVTNNPSASTSGSTASGNRKQPIKFGHDRRASVSHTLSYSQQPQPPKETARHKLSLGGLLKRGGGPSSSDSPVQNRITKKKYERSASKDLGEAIMSKKGFKKTSLKETTTSPTAEAKRSNFTQTRSHTGLNLFGGRRRSIAITDDAYSAAIRNAKSNLDLAAAASEATAKMSSSANTYATSSDGGNKVKKKSLPEVMREQQTPHKQKERPWADIERLWTRRIIDPPPNLTAFLSAKPPSPEQKRETLPAGTGSRALTLPASRSTSDPNKPKKATKAKTPTPEVSHSKGYWPPPSSRAGSGSNLTPPMMHKPEVPRRSPLSFRRKAVDLLAPHVMDEWQNRKSMTLSQSLMTSTLATSGFGAPEDNHFADLVRAW